MILKENKPRLYRDAVEDYKHEDNVDVRKEMAREAMENINDFRQDTVKWLNGEKEEWGTGVSTLVMIYNATGGTMTKYGAGDESGHIWKYDYDDRIETGQWSSVLHVKSSATMTGSAATVGYYIDGYTNGSEPIVLSIGWDTPWTGENTGYASHWAKSHWLKTSWKKINKYAGDGKTSDTRELGLLRSHFSTTQNSSPIFECVITRSDIGYYD